MLRETSAKALSQTTVCTCTKYFCHMQNRCNIEMWENHGEKERLLLMN